MANYDKVKILVVGDSGVGKTSAVHLMVSGTPLPKPSWTVGVGLEVKLHEFRGGTPSQKTYFIELWDIGGSSAHANTRHIFYHGVNGIILVHDVSNRKSEANLHKWLYEIFNIQRGDGSQGSSINSPGSGTTEHSSQDEFDPEQFMGSSHPPILVVGTKSDSYSSVGLEFREGDTLLPTRTSSQQRPSSIAQECGAEEIFLNCLDAKSLAPGSTASVKLTRFYDKVIDRRFHKDNISGGLYDRRKLYPTNNRMFQ